MTSIKELQERVHMLAVDKGWWDQVDTRDPNVIAAKLALIHSEVSEALEEVRDTSALADFTMDENGKMVGFPTELADVVIRVLDLGAALDINLEYVIELKHQYNISRTHRHGGRRL